MITKPLIEKELENKISKGVTFVNAEDTLGEWDTVMIDDVNKVLKTCREEFNKRIEQVSNYSRGYTIKQEIKKICDEIYGGGK